MKVSSCIIKAVKDLFTPEVIKVVLITALPLFLFYFGILFLFWDEIINFSNLLISWVPFSVLKLNGAFFILFFLWFISVVVTFAIISAILGPIFLKNLSERGHYLYTVSLIFILSLFYAFLFINNWDFINSEVQRLLTVLPFDTVSKAVGAIVAVYIFYNLFILSLFMVIFAFAKPFLEAIRELEYPDLEINTQDKFKFKRVFLKDVFLFIVLFILLFPLFFIPVVNIGVQVFLWTKLYHDSFIYFVCNEYCSNEEFEELKRHKLKTILIAIIAASFNFLPIINFFAPFFAVIMFFHCVMQLKRG
jgi:hypothetical protein